MSGMARRTRRAMWVMVAGVLATAAGLATAPPASATVATGFSLSLVGFTHPTATSTKYTWRLDGPEGGDVSHIVIDTCLGNTATSVDPAADEYKDAAHPDPTTGATGYKWESPPPAVGDEFSLTFAGVYDDSGSASTAVKKGSGDGSVVLGTTGGPNCEPVHEV